MKLSHTKLVVLSGLVWFAVGIYLLQLGLGLLVDSANAAALGVHYPLLKSLTPYLGDAQAVVLLLVVVALFVGYMKGRHVLGKSAQRGVDRIRAFPDPAPLKNIYSPKYYILLGLMVALGVSIKFFGVSNDIRGFVDTIIGAALINGAMVYFKLASALKPAVIDAKKD